MIDITIIANTFKVLTIVSGLMLLACLAVYLMWLAATSLRNENIRQRLARERHDVLSKMWKRPDDQGDGKSIRHDEGGV